MILKPADDKSAQIKELQRLIGIAPPSVKPKVEKELRMLQAGLKGEKEAAYFIDFAFKDSLNTGVIHDLRLEVNGRVAQIDHLLVNRTMTFYVLETKFFHAGIKIGEDGQFLKWNNFSKNYEGMPSPLAQNDRHITVLNDLINQIEWPTRLGLKLTPKYESFVMASAQSRIDRPKKFSTSQVIKVDELVNAIDKSFDAKGVLGTFGTMAKVVSTETIQGMGRAIMANHRPLMPDYVAKFCIAEPETSHAQLTAKSSSSDKTCKKCGSSQVSILYGKYGYYFKCSACDGNTAIKLKCEHEEHKVRLRKEGTKFFGECSDCNSSYLYFQNP